MKNWRKVVARALIAVLFFSEVEGLAMSISPSSVYLLYTGQGQNPVTTFVCARISATDVRLELDKVISLGISRKTNGPSQDPTLSIIAFIEPNEGAKIPVTQDTTDVQNRGRVSGTVDSLDYTQSWLQLEFDTNKIECVDVGQYTCTFTYRDTGWKLHEVESSMNLSVKGLPSDVTLSAKRFGSTVEGPINNPYLMNEGEEIEFTCTGNIGSSTSLQFEWWITGSMGFIKFRPDIQPNAVETQGEAPPGSSACTNSRKTTMKYQITTTDRNRGWLTFMCFVEVIPPSPTASYPLSSTAFYIAIAGPPVFSSTVSSTFSTTEPPCIQAPDNTKVDAARLAAVAGTMGAVIVILLVTVILLGLVILKKLNCVTCNNKDLTYEVPNRATQG